MKDSSHELFIHLLLIGRRTANCLNSLSSKLIYAGHCTLMIKKSTERRFGGFGRIRNHLKGLGVNRVVPQNTLS